MTLGHIPGPPYDHVVSVPATHATERGGDFPGVDDLRHLPLSVRHADAGALGWSHLANSLAVIRMLLNRNIVGGIACALALTAVLGGCRYQDPQFSPATLPDGQVGSPYAATTSVDQIRFPVDNAIVADGALPAGLSLELDSPVPPGAIPGSVKIRISGTPTVAGTFSFRVELLGTRDRSGELLGAQGYTLVVK